MDTVFTEQEQLLALKESLRWALDWIDAVPENVVLPAMPGFDRDYVENLLATPPVKQGLSDE